MTTPDFTDQLARSEKALNNALREFEESRNDPDLEKREFFELKLHSCIFHYDVSSAMKTIEVNKPTGFAAAVGLKSLILHLYEYDVFVEQTLIRRLLKLAEHRNPQFDRDSVRAERNKWKSELLHLDRWRDIRNLVAGHYDPDVSKQVALLKGMDREEVASVVRAFVSYHLFFLQALRDIGRGPSPE